MLIVGGLEVAAELVGGEEELGFEAEVGAVVGGILFRFIHELRSGAIGRD